MTAPFQDKDAFYCFVGVGESYEPEQCEWCKSKKKCACAKIVVDENKHNVERRCYVNKEDPEGCFPRTIKGEYKMVCKCYKQLCNIGLEIKAKLYLLLTILVCNFYNYNMEYIFYKSYSFG